MESATESIHAAQAQRNSVKLKGEVAYIRAFDLAYDMKRQRIGQILGQTVHDYVVGPSKPGPKQGFFYRPQMVTLPPRVYQSSVGPLEVSITVKIFNVGAVSIQVRTPFEVSSIEELVDYYGLNLAGKSIEAEVIRIAEQVRRELAPYLVRPVPVLGAVAERKIGSGRIAGRWPLCWSRRGMRFGCRIRKRPSPPNAT